MVEGAFLLPLASFGPSVDVSVLLAVRLSSQPLGPPRVMRRWLWAGPSHP